MVRFEGFVLDRRAGCLFEDRTPVPLQPATWDLLCILVDEPGRTWTRRELSQRLWPDRKVSDATLTKVVSRLRKALTGSKAIETVPGEGYRFAASLAAPSDDPDATALARLASIRAPIPLEAALAALGPDPTALDALERLAAQGRVSLVRRDGATQVTVASPGSPEDPEGADRVAAWLLTTHAEVVSRARLLADAEAWRAVRAALPLVRALLAQAALDPISRKRLDHIGTVAAQLDQPIHEGPTDEDPPAEAQAAELLVRAADTDGALREVLVLPLAARSRRRLAALERLAAQLERAGRLSEAEARLRERLAVPDAAEPPGSRRRLRQQLADLSERRAREAE